LIFIKFFILLSTQNVCNKFQTLNPKLSEVSFSYMLSYLIVLEI